MPEIKLENVQVTVSPHPSATRDYCVITLKATLDGVPCTESIALDSNFMFERVAEDNYRNQLLNDVITKLSYDMLAKSFKGFDKKVKDSCNNDEIFKGMKELYERS